MSSYSQRSFARGEVSPSLYARSDVQAYGTALRLCRNMLVMRQGGAAYRPGTAFVDTATRYPTAPVRLVPFVFSVTDALVLLIRGADTDGCLRIYRDGVALSQSGFAAYDNATAYVVGDVVTDGGIGYYCIADTTGHAPPNTAYWFQMTTGYYELPVPWASADLPTLAYVQSADVVTFVHPSYPPYELTRYSDTHWVLSQVTFTPSVDAPTGVTLSAGGAAATATDTAYWGVTTVDPATGEESLLSTSLAGPKLTPTTGSPGSHVTITWTANPDIPNATYRVYRSFAGVFSYVGVGGAATPETPASDTFASPFSFFGSTVTLPAVANIPIASAGSVIVYVDGSHFPSPDGWDVDLATGVVTVYNVDLAASSIRVDYQYVGSPTTTFEDDGITPDTTVNPPVAFTGLQTPDNYPSVVGYYQQRLLFANTNTEPTRVWASRTGLFHNFTSHSIIQADDAFNFTLANAEVDAVKHLIELGKLVVGTEGSEMLVEGDANGVLTPLAINARIGSYNGANAIRPVKVDNSILYVQALGTLVRELISNIQYGYYQFSGADLTVYASHLFDAHSLEEWAYQQVFPQVLWAVRDDGVLLGLTYIREQEMVAWHQHTTDGLFTNICCIPEGGEHRVYTVVTRTINGVECTYLERFQSLHLADVVEDASYMDCALEYDGRGYGTTRWIGDTVTLSGGTNWTFDELLTLTGTNADTFAGEVTGNEYWLTIGTTTVRFRLTHRVSNTVAQGFCAATVPDAFRNVACGAWAVARSIFYPTYGQFVNGDTSLLTGKALSVFADGFVVSSPNNPAITTVVTADPTTSIVTLDQAHAHVRLGLPYMGDIETLDLDTPSGPTFKESAMAVSRAGIYVERSNTRGTFAGIDEPTGTDPVQNLYEVKGREVVNYSDPLELISDYVEVNVASRWNKSGRVFIRQVDPVPMTILAVFPMGFVPVQGG